MNCFQKSDIGAQAAWKGFSSQTLYIASRLISNETGYEYYPEDIEDLVVKRDGIIVEAVQVKNTTDDLTLSSLASTKTSIGGEGFFRRMCSLHATTPSFHCIKVVYFNAFGLEFQKVQAGDIKTKQSIVKKLVDKHGLFESEAHWLIESLSFEKVSLNELDLNILNQISQYVPVMSAPELAKELLIQHISVLSKSKGYTTLKMWQEKIHEIGTNIAAIDGFYKEYNKSLVRLDELQLNGDHEQLEKEYLQGVSAHPTHIRNNFDFKRNYWMEEIRAVINNKGVAILKGVSGQGKTTLCFRYLIDTYPEGCVFCVRTIANEGQAQNLVSALDGLGKHNENLIIYTEESRIAKPMYPCEIEPVLIEKINATKSLNLWIEAMKKLGEMKLYIQRYQQVIQVPADEKCLCSITAHTELLINQINALWNDFILKKGV